jgi:secondary thiamine-phosphate synthase enzyme
VGLMRDRHVKASHKAQVWGMYVEPGRRGRGVGAGLLRAALQHAGTLAGVSSIHLSVTSAAVEARRLYERAGFEVWGTEPDALRHEGRAVVEYHMALPLAAGVGFRALREGDIEEIFDVRGATRENAISRERLAAMGITPASIAEHLAAGTTRGWVCSSGSRIVGFCIAERATGEVLVLAVLPAFEGRGIGKTLLSLAVEWLRSFTPARVWLGASSDPATRSYGFYRSLGWRPVGEKDTHGDEILALPGPGGQGRPEEDAQMGAIAPSTIEIETQSPNQVIDITGHVDAMLDGTPGGTCHLYLKHTTAALTVMTWEAGVPEDIMDVLRSLTPNLAYRHDSAAHVAAHFLSALVGPSVHVPVRDGKLGLGEFQRVVLLEFEGPRKRQIELRLLG